jgi:hypothetical protein
MKNDRTMFQLTTPAWLPSVVRMEPPIHSADYIILTSVNATPFHQYSGLVQTAATLPWAQMTMLWTSMK